MSEYEKGVSAAFKLVDSLIDCNENEGWILVHDVKSSIHSHAEPYSDGFKETMQQLISHLENRTMK